MPSTKTDQIYLVKGAGRKHPPFFMPDAKRAWPRCNIADITHAQKRRHDGGVMMQPICPARLRNETG